MNVVVADRKFPELADPYGDVIRTNGGTIRYADCRTEADVIDRCTDADVLLVFKAPITETVARSLERTKLIVRIGTGYDNVNVKAATENGIMVSNTPGYSKHEVATHAITLMLAAAREVAYSDRDMRASNGFGERRPVNSMNHGTFGIVGLGRIGRAAVSKARGLAMDVVAYDPYVPEDVFLHLDVSKGTFTDVLETADCVSIHAPLTAETRHLFSTAEFELMKETAVLVNTARGPIVDERALVDAVESGEIWAAGLDVFEREPPTDSPVLECDRIVCSPHHAGKCDGSRERNIEIVRQVLTDALLGNHPEFLVNPEVLQYTDSQLNPEYHEWTRD